jgi:hypothetical protein
MNLCYFCLIKLKKKETHSSCNLHFEELSTELRELRQDKLYAETHDNYVIRKTRKYEHFISPEGTHDLHVKRGPRFEDVVLITSTDAMEISDDLG